MIKKFVPSKLRANFIPAGASASELAFWIFIGLAPVLSSLGANCDPPPNDIIGWWSGDGDGSDIYSTNTGTLGGGAIATTPGIVGTAFLFDGTNSYVSIPDSQALHPTNFTIEAWIRCDNLDTPSINSYPGQQYIIFHQNSQSGNFEGFDIAKDREPRYIGTNDTWCFEVSSPTGSNVFVESLTLVRTNEWFHIAGVRANDYIQIYVNGKLEAQTNVYFPTDYGNHPLYFATTGQSYYDHKFAGALDEVTLYNRVLSASEIAAIYAAGAAGKCKPLNPPTVTMQPQSQTVSLGGNALFTVAASGAPPLSYQWRFNDAPIAGATTTSLAVNSAQSSNSGIYTVLVTNSIGSATSAVATLTVNLPGTCAPAPPNLVGWWTADGSAADYLGLNNGTLQGTATANAAGEVAQAFSFDGVNGYVQVPNSAALNPTNLTIEAWVLFNSLDSAGNALAGQQYIVFKQNSRSGAFEGYFLGKVRGSGGDYFSFGVTSASGVSAGVGSTTPISTGIWYHVAAVRGSDFIQLFVNGRLVGQTGVSFPQDYGSFPLFFGSSGQSYWDRKFAGLLDEISLYDRALSASEISAIYAAGAAGKCKAPALRLFSPVVNNGQVTVTWQSVAGVKYFLERSSDLAAPSPVFTPLATGIVGQEGTTVYVDSNLPSSSMFFYRVGIEN
ncbi:MAG TPA: LamG-like jellyroll fold domain-containing protein [Candidatus Limnocylindrales bacterium]|jgi:hypothetical protein|nr:LamG-like jellyroll fold domain-containing protein [Candidatus Limnocylindrales bacterium]